MSSIPRSDAVLDPPQATNPQLFRIMYTLASLSFSSVPKMQSELGEALHRLALCCIDLDDVKSYLEKRSILARASTCLPAFHFS